MWNIDMSASHRSQTARQRTALIVLTLSLAVTFFGAWREHVLSQRNDAIHTSGQGEVAANTSPAPAIKPVWIVLTSGLFLSGLMYFCF